MTKKMIPVEDSIAEWRKDPAYVKAYNALEDEFSLAKAISPTIENLLRLTASAK